MVVQNKKTSLLSIVIPVSADILQESIRLVNNKNTRIENLAICASQDPALVIEILKNANTSFFSGGKTTTTSVKSALTRLGGDTINSILTGLQSRPEPENEKVFEILNLYRDKSKRASIIARMFSESINKMIEEECLASGLFLYLGYILAIMSLGEDFVKIAENNSQATLKFKLAKDYNIDVEQASRDYLIKQGMPDMIISGLDRDSIVKNDKNKSLLKSIVWSAYEFIEYFDSNKWGKLAPGQILSPKSPIRALPLNETQYRKIYERAAGYFISNQLLNMTKLKSRQNAAKEAQEQQENAEKEFENESINQTKTIIDASFQNELNELLGAIKKDKFKLKQAKDEPIKEARKSFEELNITKPIDTYSEESNKLLRKTELLLNNIKTSEEAIKKILELLVDKGPFEKACIIVVSDDKDAAIVACSRGPIGNGQKISITDSISPLAQSFSKVQSFGNKEGAESPFRSKSFAITPLDVNHTTPVSLYADCGDKSLTFEARRIFRNIADILNQRLPALAGGIPIEVSVEDEE